MKLTPVIREAKRILQVTSKSDSWSAHVTIPRNFKRPLGSRPLYWLYISANKTLDDLAESYFLDGAGNTIITFEELVNLNLAFIYNTSAATAKVALPETLLLDQVKIVFAAEATGSVFLLREVPALEGYSPESFGHYYITRHLVTLDANHTELDLRRYTLCWEDYVFVQVNGAGGMTLYDDDNNIMYSATLTSGLYSDMIAASSTSIGLTHVAMGALKYASRIAVSNITGTESVVLDLPVLSL
jgi:hypothetical protein